MLQKNMYVIIKMMMFLKGIIKMNKIIIEKEKLNHNINIIKKQILENGTSSKIIAVLKNDAYGVSMPIQAKVLLENGINFFAVTDVYEAIELKKYSQGAEILILNSTSVYDEVKIIVENNFIASCGSFSDLEVLENVSKEENKNTRYHLNIDTGMHRFGFRADELLKNNLDENVKGESLLIDLLVQSINSFSNIKLDGIYTHFQQSYEKDSTKTKEQFDLFINTINRLKERGVQTGIAHCCNTSAFFKYPYMQLDAVRIGSALSGRVQAGVTDKLKRVGYLESTICEIRDLKEGDKVFYSGTYTAKTNMIVGIVEAGYSDGFGLMGPRDCSTASQKLRQIKEVFSKLFKDTNNYVLVKDKKCKVLGRIGMKNFVCDLSNVGDVEVGEKVKIDVGLSLCDSRIKREEV